MNDTILSSLRSILLERTDPSNLPDEVWKRSAALNTWGTNAIEGSTISWKDAQRILLENRSISNKPISEVLETIQHERAFRGLIGKKEEQIDLSTILELHEEVFKGILPDAGSWRRINVRIQGASFSPPRMERVIDDLRSLVDEYNKRDLEGENVFSLGAFFHFGFEYIHPFSDGNGRIGRLLLNLHFIKHNWAPIHIFPQDRKDYLDSLNSANGSDLKPLVEFLQKAMGSSLLDLLDQLGTSEDELMDLEEASKMSPYSKKYLGLRCKQGELPGVLADHRWQTSRRALELYNIFTGRI